LSYFLCVFVMEQILPVLIKTLSLPDDVDKEAISASYEHGILSVEIPRKSKPVSEETKSISIS